MKYTVEQLDHIATAKYAEAAMTPKGLKRDALLAAAKTLAFRAEVKNWVSQQLQKFPSRVYH